MRSRNRLRVDMEAAMAENEDIDVNDDEDAADGLAEDDTPDEPLRAEGEKALRSWKERARQAEKQVKHLRSHAATLQEQLLEVQRRADRERLEALVVMEATGKLQDPADAVRFLDLDELDADQVPDAVAQLVDQKQYLAVSGPTRPAGDVDQGARLRAEPRDLGSVMDPSQVRAMARQNRR